ncbi:MAG TPA: hypothetical protein VGY13_01905 [Solirubrobacteraceae bacterium]|jgi:hypothetical protein|nr:hypothetical protein [Solirubrobacteraceae bacterium]
MRKRVGALLVLAALAGLVPASAALAGPAVAGAAGQERAARAFLEAELRFEDVFPAGLSQARAEADAVVARVSGECPGALAHAPVGNALDRMQTLEVDELVFAFVLPYDTAALEFAATVSRLRFGESRIGRAVRELAREDRLEVDLRLPSACAAPQQWAAAGFGALPATVLSQLHALDRLTGAGRRVSLASVVGLIAAHGPPAIRPLVARVRRQIHRTATLVERNLNPILVRFLRALDGPGHV